MTNQTILSIDQGTTSSRAFLLDSNLNVKGVGQNEFRQHYPKPGWVEHDAEEIWESTLKAIRDALASTGTRFGSRKRSELCSREGVAPMALPLEGATRAPIIDPKQIAAIGITNQRETTILWDRKTGKAIANAIVWQDRRTTERCQELKQKNEEMVRNKTGLVLDPYFSGTKIEWLLANIPGAKAKAEKGELCFGTVDCFLLWRLTCGKVHATDATNASRTLLMNLKTLEWDEELLDLFHIPKSILPRIVPCAEKQGVTKGVQGLPDGIPIAGMAGDQQAALVGQACFEVGEAKCTYGTGSFILMNIGKEPKPSKHGLITTLAYQRGNEVAYAYEGSAFIAGAAVQWLRDGLKIIKHSSEVEALAASVPDSHGVIFVPAFVGLGAPYWRADARGAMTGITRGATSAHIARATLEGIAFCQYDILEAMTHDVGKPLASLKVDGGAASNNLLMQFQSDILQVSISRPLIIETTALGAAFLAGLGVGIWKDWNEIRKSWKEEKHFTPKMSKEEVKNRIKNWHSAIDKL